MAEFLGRTHELDVIHAVVARAMHSDYQAPDHLTIEHSAPTRSSITDEQRQLNLLVEVTPGR